MVKGVAVKLKSYEETIPKLLKLIKFDEEIKKHDKIVLKPNLSSDQKTETTQIEFVEQVLKFIMENKSPGTEIFIAEGSNGFSTFDLFDSLGYTNLSEKYGVGLIDLNNAETEEIKTNSFMEFESIRYPKILLDSFIISLPYLKSHEKTGILASLDNMLGVFPAKHYKGVFSRHKNKLNKYPIKYQIHDAIQCKIPEFAIIDASNQGFILAGQPLEMDKQAAKVLGLDWQEVDHLRLIDQTLSGEKEEINANELIEETT